MGRFPVYKVEEIIKSVLNARLSDKSAEVSLQSLDLHNRFVIELSCVDALDIYPYVCIYIINIAVIRRLLYMLWFYLIRRSVLGKAQRK